jgi:mono/diheme cytochrome c family protein
MLSITDRVLLMIRNLPVTFWSLLFLSLTACTSRTGETSSIATDSVTVMKGQTAFLQNCSACHNFRQDGIGPQLGGITQKVSAEWIKNFIKNPQEMINAGDEHAQNLYKKYNTVMPSFGHLAEEDLQGIVAFLNTQKSTEQHNETGGIEPLKNPIPDTIKLSDLVVGLKLVTQIPASDEKSPLTRITKLDFQPNTDKLFILDLRGKLYQLQNNKPMVYMDMAKVKTAFVNKPGLATGFGSFAFHPDFAKNGLLYTTHTEPPATAKADFGYADSIKVTLQWVLSEWKTETPEALPFSGKSRELLRVNVVSGIHGVQEITFNPLAKPRDEDYGLLYIGIGDGGSVENGFPFLAHSTDKVWGSILRIDPAGNNSANGRYGIPKGNPFVKMKKSVNMLGEIYAYGFRNPHRITWSQSGLLLSCNVGHGNIESLDIILPGHDYGWPIREGNFVLNPFGDMNKIYPLPSDDEIYNITYPVAEYDHDEGKAISGGFEYTGTSLPLLKGKYFFGDIPIGRLFFVDVADLKLGSQAVIKEWKVSLDGKVKSLADITGSQRVDLHFGKDRQGELYIMTKPDGKVYKLASAAIKHQ